VFVQTAPVDLPRLDEIAIDARVVVFGMVITLMTALLVAALPLWHLGGRDPQAVLRSGSAGAGHGPSGVRARTALTAFQIAVTIALLSVTSLLGLSLWRVLGVDYGFNAERVLSVPVALPAARYAEDQQRVQAYDRILEAVTSLPGVRAVSSTSLLPMRGEGQVNFVVAAGTNVPRSQQPSANFRLIGPEYFSSLELPVQRGRTFTLADRGEGKPMPAVISQSLAARLWPSGEALGQSFSRGIDGEAGFLVVGIAADARTTAVERQSPLMVYVPYWWRSRATLSLLVKSDTDPIALAPGIRRVIERIDPEIADRAGAAVAAAGRRCAGEPPLPGARVHRLRSRVAADRDARCLRRHFVRGGQAPARNEHPRRAGRGQSRCSQAVDDTAGQRRWCQASGSVSQARLAAGSAAASLLYEVTPRDPLVLAGVAATVTMVAIAASLLATRNSLSIDPMAALRKSSAVARGHYRDRDRLNANSA
jgi:hypothetical protein